MSRRWYEFMAPSSSVEREGSRTNAAIWFSYWLKKMRSSRFRMACKMESSTGTSPQAESAAAGEVSSNDAGGVSVAVEGVGPAMKEEKRCRVGDVAPYVDIVNGETINFGFELRECIYTSFGCAPGVVVCPMITEPFNILWWWAKCPRWIESGSLRPRVGGYARLDRSQFLLGNANTEWCR